MSRCRMLVGVMVALVALSGLALGQEEGEGGITWISLMETKPGKGMDLVQATQKHDAAMYEELLANGTINSWGMALPINHREGDTWNHMLWVDMDDWSEVGDLQGGFMKLFSSRTPEQSKAIEAEFMDAVVENSHFDWIVRDVVEKGSGPAAQTNYFSVGYWRANPGAGEQVTEFYKKHVAPIYDELLAEGVITGYGMFMQELHTDPSWSHVGWYGISSLGAVDKVTQALAAGLADVDMSAITEAMDPDGHWDQILVVVHMGGRTAAP